MPDFDYKQVAKSPEYLENFPKIFREGITNLDEEHTHKVFYQDCHYSDGKYYCYCKSNICRKDIKR